MGQAGYTFLCQCNQRKGKSMTGLTDEQRVDIVKYRLENAFNTLSEVESHRKNGFYNTAVNRMYYACYYAARAILTAYHIEAKSHEGVRQQLGLNFVLTGKISEEQGRFYSRLFSKRTTGDYDDFINHTLETVDELYPQAQAFVNTIAELLKIWFEEQSQNQ